MRGLLIPLLLLAHSIAWTNEQADPELRQALMQAVADSSSFADRFEAEVWLMDMAQRLARFIPERQDRLQLLRLVHAEAERSQLDPEVVLAVIEVESHFDRFAISVAGAQGLMQIMPFWLKEIGRPNDNLFHIQTNLRMGTTILRYYLDREQGNLTEALARYNGSHGRYTYPQKVFQALRQRWFKQ